jgi:hypothetical protein
MVSSNADFEDDDEDEYEYDLRYALSALRFAHKRERRSHPAVN